MSVSTHFTNLFRTRRAFSRIVMLCVVSVTSFAQESPGEVERWIGQLGSEVFAEREVATAELWKIGEPALEALREAAELDDPEIRLRAGEILINMDLGISPAWSAELRQQALGFEKLEAAGRKEFLRMLAAREASEFFSFLLMRVRKGDPKDAETAADLLVSSQISDELQARLLKRVQQPVNTYEGRILAEISEKIGQPEDLAAALTARNIPEKYRDRLIQAALRHLKQDLATGAFEGLIDHARMLSESAPNEARFLYFQAAGTAKTGDKTRAGGLIEKAQLLNPEDKVAHYRAAELLEELDQSALALQEWKRLLEIPPFGEVYDMNAHMSMAGLYAKRKKFALAADAYERGLTAYRAGKGSANGAVIMSIPEVELEKRIADLRVKAEAAADTLTLQLDAIVQDNRGDELQKVLADADVQMSIRVQPYGFRLLEVAPATVAYESERGEYVVLLNGKPAGKGAPGKLEPRQNRVVVKTLDRFYLYEVDGETGIALKKATFNVDYVLQIQPGPHLAARETSGAELNGEYHTWEALGEGIPFDVLPEKMELEIKGLTPEGKEQKINFSIAPAKLKPRFR